MNQRTTPSRRHAVGLHDSSGAPTTSAVAGSARAWTAILILFACLSVAFGGATRQNALVTTVLQLLSVPILVYAVHRLTVSPLDRRLMAPVALFLAILAVPLLQLAPLPFELWSAVPGRDPAETAMELSGTLPTAAPLSLDPSATLRTALALTPAAAAFFATLLLQHRGRQAMAWAWLALAAASLFLGVLQVATGDGSLFYLYERTNAGYAVGFFSNRNHQAALIAAGVPLAAALMAGAQTGQRPWGAYVQLVSLASIFVAVVSLGVIRSSAGLILLGLGLAGSGALIWQAQARGRGAGRALGLILVSLAGASLVALFALQPLLTKLGGHFGGEPRLEIWRVSAEVAAEHLPFGSGLGTFDLVYRAAEPLASVGPQYVNHAHNDYLELLIEAGLPAAIVLGAFVIWWLKRTLTVWRRSETSPDTHLMRAASLVVGMLLMHSWLDYPLRTDALAVLFAMACAILARPPVDDPSSERV